MIRKLRDNFPLLSFLLLIAFQYLAIAFCLFPASGFEAGTCHDELCSTCFLVIHYLSYFTSYTMLSPVINSFLLASIITVILTLVQKYARKNSPER